MQKVSDIIKTSSSLASDIRMPLPRLKSAQLCTARSKRTKQPCKNPAAHGMKVCRMHGARKKETIKYGADHPQFKDGKRTREYMTQQSEQIAELQALEEIGYRIGMMEGPRTRGRKSNNYTQALLGL